MSESGQREQRAIEKLRECQKNRDFEAAHSTADDVLCDLLRELGFGKVVDEWMKVDKWYA